MLLLGEASAASSGFEKRANEQLEAAAPLPRVTSRALILERAGNGPGVLTVDDFASLKRALEADLNKRPALNQPPLVDVNIVRQRGAAAAAEVERARSAITALEAFFKEFIEEISR